MEGGGRKHIREENSEGSFPCPKRSEYEGDETMEENEEEYNDSSNMECDWENGPEYQWFEELYARVSSLEGACAQIIPNFHEYIPEMERRYHTYIYQAEGIFNEYQNNLERNWADGVAREEKFLDEARQKLQVRVDELTVQLQNKMLQSVVEVVEANFGKFADNFEPKIKSEILGMVENFRLQQILALGEFEKKM